MSGMVASWGIASRGSEAQADSFSLRNKTTSNNPFPRCVREARQGRVKGTSRGQCRREALAFWSLETIHRNTPRDVHNKGGGAQALEISRSRPHSISSG